MDPEVKKLVDWATANGWTAESTKGKSGHYVLRHPDCDPVVLSATPSDWRGMKNAWARVTRATGKAPGKNKAAHYRHTGQKAPGFSMEAAQRDREERWNKAHDLPAMHAGHLEEIEQLNALGRRISATDLARAHWLVGSCLRIEKECEQAGYPVDNPLQPEEEEDTE